MGASRSVSYLVGASVAATSLLVLVPSETFLQLVVLCVALALFGALFSRSTWRDALSVRHALLASSILLVVAVVAEPYGSDIWYYQMYGRIAVEHHDNPYLHAPAEYVGDPVLPRTGGVWDGVRAEYGPLFVAIATAVATVTGSNAIAARLAWQGMAALAVFLALVLIGRRTQSGVAVALVGMNPVMVHTVVNAGHNDALVGLAVLGSILLCARRRDLAAVLVLTAAVLVKVPVGFGLAAMLAWLAWHRGVKPAVRLAFVAATTLAVALFAAGGTEVLRPMLLARARSTNLSPWNLLRDNGLTRFAGRLDVLGEMPALSTAAVAAAVLLAAFVIFRRIRDDEPTLVVAFAIVAWLLTAHYTQAWYIAWVLPALALRRSSHVTAAIVALHGLHLLAALADGYANVSIWQSVGVPIFRISAYLQGATMVAVLATIVVFVEAARPRRPPEESRPSNGGAEHAAEGPLAPPHR